MVLEVRLNLGCASGLVLGRKDGLYRFDSAGEFLNPSHSHVDALTYRRAHSYPPQNRFLRYRGPFSESEAVL